MPAARFPNPARRKSSPPFSTQHADKNYYVIAYINCSAGVKALSDVICTSGNAEKIVRAAPEDRNILFVPDQNLGAWVIEKTGRKMDLWQGNCYVHVEFTAQSIGRIHEEYPGAPVVAHPECPFAVRLLADEVCSTEKMIDFCRQSPAKEIIVVTEAGMLHRLQKEVPGKTFHSRPDRSLRLRRVPLHEDEHAGKSARRAARPQAGDHPPGAAAETRRSSHPAHARAEPLDCTHSIKFPRFTNTSLSGGRPERLRN